MVGEEGRDAVRTAAGCGREGDRDRASELFWGECKGEWGGSACVCFSIGLPAARYRFTHSPVELNK